MAASAAGRRRRAPRHRKAAEGRRKPRHTQEAARHFGEFDKPVLVAWATEKDFFPVEYGERLARDFPQGRLERIEDSWTFVPEDQPERLAELIARSHGSRRGRRPERASASALVALALGDRVRQRLGAEPAVETRDQARREAEQARAIGERGGATSISARFFSMPLITAPATWSGVRVPTPRGSFTPLSANIPASRMKPGNTVVDSDPRAAQLLVEREAEPAQAELGRVVDRRPRARELPDSEEMKTRWPEPRSLMPGSSARASCTGARRFTSSARSISSAVKLSSRPDAGSAAFATSTSICRARDQRRDLRRIRQVRDQRLDPVDLACELVEHLARFARSRSRSRRARAARARSPGRSRRSRRSRAPCCPAARRTSRHPPQVGEEVDQTLVQHVGPLPLEEVAGAVARRTGRCAR